MRSYSRGGRRNRFAADALTVRERRRRHDPAHGQQQLTLFHGYYGQNQYFPLIITNAETGLTVFVSLRHGTAHAALGADEDLETLIARVRRRWPDVGIEVCGDSGFGVPAMYEVYERLSAQYTQDWRRSIVRERAIGS